MSQPEDFGLLSDKGKVRLRLPELADRETLYRIRSDRTLQHQLMAYPPMLYTDDVDEWLSRRLRDKNGFFRVVVDVETNQCIGFVQVVDIHHLSHHGYVGIALLPEKRAVGLGRAALSELFAIASLHYSLRKLLLIVLADNERAIRVYRGSEFRTVGILREHYCLDGVWRDAMIMERIL